MKIIKNPQTYSLTFGNEQIFGGVTDAELRALRSSIDSILGPDQPSTPVSASAPKRLSLKQLTDLVAYATAEELPRDVVHRTFLYLSLGLKISAIKSVRERYGLGLKEAKDVVERLMDFNFNNGERLEDLLDGSVKRYISEDGR